MPDQVGAIIKNQTDNKRERPQPVLILGLGNILLQDEGFGAHVAQEMLRMDLPENVEVIDGGTSSLDVLLCTEGVTKLIIIDVIKAGGEPGTVYRLKIEQDITNRLEQIFSPAQRGTISLHQMGLIDVLAAAEKLNKVPPEIVIIGVEPKEMSWGLDLTDMLRKKVSRVINLVFEEV